MRYDSIYTMKYACEETIWINPLRDGYYYPNKPLVISNRDREFQGGLMQGLKNLSRSKLGDLPITLLTKKYCV